MYVFFFNSHNVQIGIGGLKNVSKGPKEILTDGLPTNDMMLKTTYVLSRFSPGVARYACYRFSIYVKRLP